MEATPEPLTTTELIDRLHAQYQAEYDKLFTRMLGLEDGNDG